MGYADANLAIRVPAAQLQPGIIYCAVAGTPGTTTYLFSASFGLTAIPLSPGEEVVASSTAGSWQLYSMMVPANALFVTVSVVADVGTTALYIGYYGCRA